MRAALSFLFVLSACTGDGFAPVPEVPSPESSGPICADFGVPSEPLTFRADRSRPLGLRTPVRREAQLTCCHTSTETIRGWVAPALRQASSCYERALRRSPTLAGRIEVHFELGWDGRAALACEDDPERARGVGDRELVACVVEAFRAVHGAPPRGCGVRQIRFPIDFAPNTYAR